MLESAIIFAQDEFSEIKTQITFLAPIEKVKAVLRDTYIKWDVDGKGEAWGYWVKLKSDNKPLMIKTFAQKNVSAKNTTTERAILPVEWHIDAENLETALRIFNELDGLLEIENWRYW